MLTRVIFSDGKVYYRVKDLKKHFGVSDYKMRKIIKQGEIPTVKLEGFGNTKFIEEENMFLLEIGGGNIIMRTSYKDFQQSYESNKSMDGFFNFMYGDVIPKKTPEELFIKTMEDMDSFEENTAREDKNKNEDEIKIEKFNEFCEEYGYSERVRTVEFVQNNEMYQLDLIINGNGKIVDDTSTLIYCYSLESIEEYLREDIKNGYLADEDGKPRLYLTKGKPFKIPSQDYLIKELFKLFRTTELDMDCTDWIRVPVDNGCDFIVPINMFLALMNDNIKIVKQEDITNNEEDIVDVDYNECL